MKNLLLCLLLLFSVQMASQNPSRWEDFVALFFGEQVIDSDLDDESEQETSTSLYQELLERHLNPIDINKSKKEDFLSLPFLSEEEADSILSFIEKQKGLLSLGELKFLSQISRPTLQFLPLFFFCAEKEFTHKQKTPRARRSYSAPKEELSLTINKPLYLRQGFKSHTREDYQKNPNCQYLGNNVSSTLRYRARHKKLFWALTAQKDEGEPFMSNKNPMFDSYSLFLAGQRAGCVEKWIVGDFRANFGMGLSAGTSWKDGMSLIESSGAIKSSFTPHTSTDEGLFFRGAAISLNLSPFALHAFASHRKLDATLRSDSITTLQLNGYHRTLAEMQKRNNTTLSEAGLCAEATLKNLRLSLSFIGEHFSRPFAKSQQSYRKYYFYGQDFFNTSLYINYQRKKINLSSETSLSPNRGLATINRIDIRANKKLKILTLLRHYSKAYLSLNGRSYKAGSRLQNEQGILIGALLKPNERVQLKLAADYAHFPFTTYYCKEASDALSLKSQLTYWAQSNTTFSLYYRYTQKPKDNSAALQSHRHLHTLKLQANYQPFAIQMSSAINLCFNKDENNNLTKGWMLSHKAQRNLSKTLNLSLNAALFNTDSYSEAFRLYEQGLIYSTPYPVCYNNGIRTSLSLLKKTKRLEYGAKYSMTHFFNTSTISTGLRQYKGSTLQDLSAQIKINL